MLETSTRPDAEPHVESQPHDDDNSSTSGQHDVNRDLPRNTSPTLVNDPTSLPPRGNDVEKAVLSREDLSRAGGYAALPEGYGLIEFDGDDDPGNPKNWSRRRRWCITVAGAALTFVVTFSSSVFSVAINQVSEEFDVTQEVAILGVSLFLLGFVFGPVVFGPASEVFGRKWPLLTGFIVFGIFQIPVAVATNVETIMLGRFFGGFAASAPLAIVGGLLSDLWDPIDRAYGICIMASGGFSGPAIAPIVGGFATQSYLGWRWTAWLTLILVVVVGGISLVVIPETSAPRILQARAKKLRYKTKNWALHAKADERQLDLNIMLTVYLVRPFVMIVQEPILALVTLYMSVSQSIQVSCELG